MPHTPWTEEQLTLALNLYCKIPFGRIQASNPEIVQLAELIGRTPSALAFKLSNFASFDPALQARGVKGLANASKLDREVWDRFFGNLGELAFHSEMLLAKKQQQSVEQWLSEAERQLPEGKTKERLVQQRVNQQFFRSMILNFYNRSCCITGISQSDLLVAAHISPWSADPANRMNPANGLCLNALHDKAYEAGWITITPEYKVLVSSKLQKPNVAPWATSYFLAYHEQPIHLPKHFSPDPALLERHLVERFQK
jgi:putative restriction endonuclease